MEAKSSDTTVIEGIFRGTLDLSFESFVEDGGEEGVEFGDGLGLQALQRVHLRLQCVQC
jgi:hypothetical protein